MMDLIFQCFSFSHVKDPVVRMYDNSTTRHLFPQKANFLRLFEGMQEYFSSMYNNRVRSSSLQKFV